MIADFVRAAFNGDLETLQRLFDDAASAERGNALHAAIENDQFPCIRFLIERGADIEFADDDFTPLAHAVDVAIDGTIQQEGEQGDEPTEVIEYLLRAGADPAPALRIAYDYRSVKVVDLLEKALRQRQS